MSPPSALTPGSVAPFARFDDMRGDRGLVFDAPLGPALVATEPGEVLPVLLAVQEAAASGCWAAGFVSYEAAAGLTSALPVRASSPREPCGELPLAWFGLFSKPKRVAALGGVPEAAAWSAGPWRPSWNWPEYQRKVATVHERIAAGDTYQCNLTVRAHSSAEGELLGLYRALALAQRGTHNAYVDTGHFVVASASPELFFDWSGDRLTTRPMKGTARRGRFPTEDAERAGSLARSAKERAENVMIVDLLRNDLGKIAQWGSVEVPALFSLERYETVWQLTSTVTARPRPGTTLVEVFEALFPCGSVTGAPKRSTMTLIAELEDHRRGAYCGAVGIVAPPGASFKARFNVAIRTVVVDRATRTALYGSGGGVTWDSSSEAEHAELLAKAAILSVPAEEFELFETIGWWPGEGLRNLKGHLERLESSAGYFGFPFDPGAARNALDEALEGASEPLRVKLLLARSGSLSVQRAIMPPAPRGPVRLEVDPDPVDSSELWLYHKTTRRSFYEARAQRHPAADDVVLLNERGELTETTIANLALRIGGRWWTPPIESGCLPGVERACRVERGELAERALRREDLLAAEAIALVSSVRGWRPAVLSPREAGRQASASRRAASASSRAQTSGSGVSDRDQAGQPLRT